MKTNLFVAFYVVLSLFFNLSPAKGVGLELFPDKTDLVSGDVLSVEVVIDDASDIVACVFTAVYPADRLSPADLPVSTEFFNLFSEKRSARSPSKISPWMANFSEEGKIKLAGVYL